jgi:hypothetical protein
MHPAHIHTRRHRRRALLLRAAPRPVTVLALGLLAAALDGCEDKDLTGTRSEPPAEAAGAFVGREMDARVAAAAAGDIHAQGTIPLPINQTFPGPATALDLTAFGATGQAGRFRISRRESAEAALSGETIGRGVGVKGTAFESGSAGFFENILATNTAPALRTVHAGLGPAGFFELSNASNASSALEAVTVGRGPALTARNRGLGTAAHFEQGNPSSIAGALFALTLGQGTALTAETKGSGRAAEFSITNTANGADAVTINNRGQGAALRVASHLPGGEGVLIST